MKKLLFLAFVSVFFGACSFGNIEEKTHNLASKANQNIEEKAIEEKKNDGYLIAKTLNTFEKKEFEELGFEVEGVIAVPNTDFLYYHIYKKDGDLDLANSIEGVLLVERDSCVLQPKVYKTISNEPKLPSEQTFGLSEGDYEKDPIARNSGYSLGITQALKAYKEVGYGQNESVVAIIDTGLNMAHKDFKDENGSSIVLYAKSCVNRNGGSYIGDGQAFTDIPLGENWDRHGHGSHCTGIMAARGNNDVGIAGVAWKNTKVISYQSLGVAGGGSAWAVYGALIDLAKTINVLRKDKASRTVQEINSLPSYLRDSDFKITQKTIPVNMSLGGSSATEFAFTALSNALKENILPVISMGNDGVYISSYPASFPGVIAIGATTGQDRQMTLSTSGSWISLAAPGDGIKSCWNNGEEDFQTLSGSSMSSAFVTGAIGYLLSFDAARNLAPYEIKNLLEKTADKVAGFSDFSFGLGHGRINILEATKKLNDISSMENPYSNGVLRVTFKNNGIPCDGSLTLIDDEHGTPILNLKSDTKNLIEIKGLLKGKKYSLIGTFKNSKEKKSITFGDADEQVDFNFNETLAWVSVMKNSFYHHGYDAPRITINIFKILPDGKIDENNPIVKYTGGKFRAASFLPEPNTAYAAEISATVAGRHFFGGNYAINISNAPVDVSVGINKQDGSRLDDATGQKQNDSHEDDDRFYTSRLKENAWGKEYAGNLVSPGLRFGSQLPDKDWYWFRISSAPSITLAKPNKPVLEAKEQGVKVKWDAVPNARYYLMILYDHENKIVGSGSISSSKTEYEINGLGDPNEAYTVSIVAMGNLIDENDSPESEKSDAKSPLPKA
ncbi:MAG: dentilisin complex serine proteinase subunit PrtP [Treponema sp.]